MAREISADLKVTDQRFAIVVTRFNDFVTTKLLSGAVDALTRHGCPEDNITHVHVPGSFEIPLTAMRLAKSGEYDAVICLGCVIRGETPHFDYLWVKEKRMDLYQTIKAKESELDALKEARLSEVMAIIHDWRTLVLQAYFEQRNQASDETPRT